MPCTTVADCEDNNACTADVCQADGSCGHVAIPGCMPCDDVSDCADDDECTTEACSAGRCEYTQAEECVCTPSTEVCGDGTDNDCDGSTDCDDDELLGGARAARLRPRSAATASTTTSTASSTTRTATAAPRRCSSASAA